MAKKKKYKKKISKVTVKEPVAKYGLRIFNSFEEANEADRRDMAERTPLQRLSNITQMLKRLFAKELSKKNDLKIHFK